jgi:hypothetical protein
MVVSYVNVSRRSDTYRGQLYDSSWTELRVDLSADSLHYEYIIKAQDQQKTLGRKL